MPTGRPSLVLTTCLVVWARGRTLEERIQDGECTAAAVEPGGSFFAPENRTKAEEIGLDIFDIRYGATFKVLTTGPAMEQYVLTQCGQNAPADQEVDAVAQLEPGFVRKHFQVPLQSATTTATVHLGFLEHLGVADRVPLVDPNAVEPCWQKALDCNATLEDGYYGNATLRTEQLASVDAVFMTCWAPDGCHAQANGVYVHNTVATPLEGSEYIKFFAAFFNKDPQANMLFSELKDAYTAAGSGYSEKPVVAWLRATSSELVLYDQPYEAAMVAAAGGVNVDAAEALADVPGLVTAVDGTRYSVPLPFNDTSEGKKETWDVIAQFTAALGGVDAVMDTSFSHKLLEYNFDEFLGSWGLTNASSLPFVLNHLVLRYDGTVATPYQGYWRSDWWESRISRADWAAKGLARALHKDPSKPFRYFRNVGLNEMPEVLTALACTSRLPVCGEGKEEVILTLGTGKGKGEGGLSLAHVAAGVALGIISLAVLASLACCYLRTKQGAQGDVELPLPQESW